MDLFTLILSFVHGSLGKSDVNIGMFDVALFFSGKKSDPPLCRLYIVYRLSFDF